LKNYSQHINSTLHRHEFKKETPTIKRIGSLFRKIKMNSNINESNSTEDKSVQYSKPAERSAEDIRNNIDSNMTIAKTSFTSRTERSSRRIKGLYKRKTIPIQTIMTLRTTYPKMILTRSKRKCKDFHGYKDLLTCIYQDYFLASFMKNTKHKIY